MRHCMEKGGKHLLQNEICLSLDETSKANDTTESGWSIGKRYERVLARLFKQKPLQSLPQYVREFVLEEQKLVYDGGSRKRSVESWLVSGVFCPTLNDYDKKRNRNSISETGGCVLQEQGVYATHESGPK